LRIFENRVLRRIFGPKNDEVARGWRIFIVRSSMICTLSDIIRMMKSRRVSLAGT
jgi:hypothetical protein